MYCTRFLVSLGMSKVAVFFDLDSTLVSIEGAVELAKKKSVLKEVLLEEEWNR